MQFSTISKLDIIEMVTISKGLPLMEDIMVKKKKHTVLGFFAWP